MQRSLIAFQNDDQDELFNYYDNRNKNRLKKLQLKANYNENQTTNLTKIAKKLKDTVKRLILAGSLLQPRNIKYRADD